MRKGSVVALVFGIILLVAGIALVGAGAWLDAPHSAVYHYGHGAFMYSARYTVASPGSGSALSSFGHLSFDAGLVLMVIFVILQINDHKEGKVTAEKARKADISEMKKAKAEAVDAEVHPETENKEN